MQPIKQQEKLNIVYIDPKMTATQIDEAITRLYELHSRVPFTRRPVSITLAPKGGYTFDVGYIVTMTPEEIANDFNERLRKGDPDAIRLNDLLLSV